MISVDAKGSKFYSNFIEKYDPNKETAKKRINELILLLKKNLRGKKVLDICCGCGLFSFEIEKKGYNLVGIDFNKYYIDIAKKYAKKIGSHITFVNKDIRKSSISEVFDNIILLGNTMPHFTLDEFNHILTKLKKNLRKKGRFIIGYNDWVGLLLTHYPREFIEKKSPLIISKHIGYSFKQGALYREFYSKKKRFKLKLIVWSPYILDYVMKTNKYKLINHYNTRGNKFLSIYEKT